MLKYQIGFDSPGYLLLLALLPVLWWFSMRSLAGLGNTRRFLALVFRSVIFLLLVAAAAEMQLRKQSDRLTVIYLLDQSLSIPREQREHMIDFVNASIQSHRERDG